MYQLILVCSLAVLVASDVSHLPLPPRFQPIQGARPIAIVRQAQDVNPDGSYQYSYETENGIAAEEQAQVRVAGNELEKVAQGQFSWTSPEGKQVSISYVADGNGYQPQGSDIPVPPPIPPAILRALEWIAAHPEPENQQRRVF